MAFMTRVLASISAVAATCLVLDSSWEVAYCKPPSRPGERGAPAALPEDNYWHSGEPAKPQAPCGSLTVNCVGDAALSATCGDGVRACVIYAPSCAMYVLLSDCKAVGFSSGEKVRPGDSAALTCADSPTRESALACCIVRHEMTHLDHESNGILNDGSDDTRCNEFITQASDISCLAGWVEKHCTPFKAADGCRSACRDVFHNVSQNLFASCMCSMKHTPPVSQGPEFDSSNPGVQQFKQDEADRLLKCKNYCSDSVEQRYSMLPEVCRDNMPISDFSEQISCDNFVSYWATTVGLPPNSVPVDKPKPRPKESPKPY
jgi:hypothetical protein